MDLFMAFYGDSENVYFEVLVGRENADNFYGEIVEKIVMKQHGIETDDNILVISLYEAKPDNRGILSRGELVKMFDIDTNA